MHDLYLGLGHNKSAESETSSTITACTITFMTLVLRYFQHNMVARTFPRENVADPEVSLLEFHLAPKLYALNVDRLKLS